MHLWRAEVQCLPFDVDAANKALDDAGWTVNPDTGLREKDGVALRFQMCTVGNPTRLTTLGKVNQYLNAISIPSDIQTADATSVYFASWADTTPDTQCSIYRAPTTSRCSHGSSVGICTATLPHLSQLAHPADGQQHEPSPHPELDADRGAGQGDGPGGAEGRHDDASILAGRVGDPLYYRAETTGVGNHLGGLPSAPSSAGPTSTSRSGTSSPDARGLAKSLTGIPDPAGRSRAERPHASPAPPSDVNPSGPRLAMSPGSSWPRRPVGVRASRGPLTRARLITSRILRAIPVLFPISLVSYGLMALAPGGPQPSSTRTRASARSR
ncbi:MAG: hypothetical protein R3C32_08975 [Chloroflexota bacterium]